MFIRTLASAALAFALSTSAFAEKTITVKFGYANPANSQFGVAANAFAKELGRLSKGEFKVIQFPASALGGERDMLEAVQLGTLEFLWSGNGPLANFVPEVGVLDVPYLFRDTDHVRKVLYGPIGENLLTKFPQHNLIGITWGENGFRNVTNNKHPVNGPQDLQGLKIRTLENQAQIMAFKAWGAAPTPMSFPELFSALEQGTVDGQDNPIAVMVTSKLYQVQKYISLTRHAYTSTVLVASPKFWNTLTPEEQSEVRQAAIYARTAMSKEIERLEATGTDTMQKQGMQIVTSVDTAKFQAALEPIQAQYDKQYGKAAIDEIRAVK